MKPRNTRNTRKKTKLVCGVFLSFFVCFVCFVVPSSAEKESGALSHRSPVDVVVLPGGSRALTANQTADSVSLVDLQGRKVLAEAPCGRRPAAVACSADGKHGAVSNLWSGTISLFDIGQDRLTLAGVVPVGPFPRGQVFASDGRTLYAAVGEEVVRLDWRDRKVTERWPAPREPGRVVLSADGRWLAAASSRSGQVRCWDTISGKLSWTRTIEDGFNLRGLAFSADGSWLICSHVVRRSFPVSRINIEEGWVIDSRLTRFAVKPDTRPAQQQIALDTKGKAVGDPDGVALSADGECLVLAAAGTHELLLLSSASVPWSSGDPGDFIDPTFREEAGKFRRLPVGGRPLALAFTDGSDQAVVANYLLDALQVVDVKAGKLLHTIPLGSPAETSLARKGETLFYDAQRSHNQWFSCHTCHVEGHTCGLSFDTLNDDSYGNPKLTPTLRRVTHTGPWTWHGWQKDLGAGIAKSLTETMCGPKPSPEDVQALLAFLETLEHPPNPNLGPRGALSEPARRGRAIFTDRAHCARCHKGPDYTSESNYDVKLESDGSPYRLWNPPSLRGLHDRGPYLHDGRARTLDELLRKHHTPEMLGGEALSPAEHDDLLAFLLSL
jgi:YVTN family beta-propeller protein